LGPTVHIIEPSLTLPPLDTDWFRGTLRAATGTLDVLVTSQGDPVVANVYFDTDADGAPDTLVASASGNNIPLEGIAGAEGVSYWIELALVTPADLDAFGAIVRLEVINNDRFDDPVGDGAGGTVINPTGHDENGPNNGPRSGGVAIEGTLRLVQPDPDIPATFQGHVGVSTDGLGVFKSGNLQAEIPVGSTIELALLYVATRSLTGPYQPSQIGFESTTVSLVYLPNVDNAAGVDFETARADVTSIVAAKVGASGGTFNFLVDETIANAGLSFDGNDNDLDQGIEGTALVVIYSNPTLPERSVAVLEGGLSGPAAQKTRLILGNPVNKLDPDFVAQLALGISFGFQASGQYTTVEVNGERMTSAAGNFNDGAAANGRLITVGGVGDNLSNPLDPFDSLDITDDERYNLSPFLDNGDIEVVLDTANPSDDDSVFLAVILLSGQVGVAPLYTDLGTVGRSMETNLTLPEGDEDWFRFVAGLLGDLAVTVNTEVGGSVSVLLYRDADADGLPDDLNGDSIADVVGTVATTTNQTIITGITFVPGDAFLARVFNPSGQAEFDIDVRIQHAPVANDDAYSTDEDTELFVAAPGIFANDTDSDGDSLTAVLVSGTTNGTLVLNADGSFTYTPDENSTTTDSFTYAAHDGTTTSTPATVTITITAVNDDPAANDDAYDTDEDTELTVAAPGVLANDTDVDGDGLTTSVVTTTANGVLVFNPDGSFTYTPDTDFFGIDSFTYIVDDGVGGSDMATVTITVNSVNDTPTANDDAYTTDEDTELAVGAQGVLTNDTDVDGDGLTASVVTTTANGVLVFNSDGSFTYTPDADFAGSDTPSPMWLATDRLPRRPRR
jgi:VCBS repeat-containing protein